MKRKIISIINIAILILIVSLLIFFCAPEISQKDSSKIEIITTIFPNYDFAKQIGGERVEVKLLLDSGVESHTYEPTPKDMIKISDSDLFVYTGTKFEPWADNIVNAANQNNLKIVDTSKNIELIKIHDFEKQNLNEEILQEHNKQHHHESENSYDSHIWMNPKNAIIMIDDILASLCDIDPEYSEYYIQNAEEYKNKILKLDKEFEEMIGNSLRDEIAFAGEFSYTYFINEYNLKFISVYNNCGHGEDPSIAKVKSVIDYINNHKLPVVFYEELSEGTVAKMIGEETTTIARVFYTIHNANIDEDTYITLMQKNYESLKESLN